MFVIKTCYSSGGSCVTAEKYHEEFSVHVVLSRDIGTRMLNSVKKQRVCWRQM